MQSTLAPWNGLRWLAPMLALVLTACGGGGGSTPNPNVPGGGQQIGTGGSITGRVFVPEGQPIGGPFVTVTVRDGAGTTLSPTINPNGTGPDIGRFTVAGLPLGTDITVSIDYRSDGRGDNLGHDQIIRLTSTGTLDIGAVTLSNEFLELGWNAYRAKNFNLALSRFNTSKDARSATAGTRSSSYFVGMGWTHVKRGRDTLVMCSGPNNQGFEWDIALQEFKQAADTDAYDADARVGMAAAYTALNAKSKLLDPVQFNLQQFFYGFLNLYYDEAEEQINQALAIAPDYESDHDEITASDLEVARLFHRFMQGKAVSQDEIDELSERQDINQGSQETLQALSDMVRYKLAPQAGGGLSS